MRSDIIVEQLGWSVPLEGDTMPLDDVEEKEVAVITFTLVRKIMCSKVLNRGAVKNILVKAWGEPSTMSIIDLGLNTYMFNFTNEETPMKISQKKKKNNWSFL